MADLRWGESDHDSDQDDAPKLVAQKPSLAELAAAANRKRKDAEARNGDSMSGHSNVTPWWIRVGVQFGVGTVIAFILLNWLQTTVDRKLDLTLAAAQETRAAQIQANNEMRAFAVESSRQAEIMLLVQRQTCANTAKSEDARDRCYATKMNGGAVR